MQRPATTTIEYVLNLETKLKATNILQYLTAMVSTRFVHALVSCMALMQRSSPTPPVRGEVAPHNRHGWSKCTCLCNDRHGHGCVLMFYCSVFGFDRTQIHKKGTQEQQCAEMTSQDFSKAINILRYRYRYRYR